MSTISATLKPGRDKPLHEGHPWIFSGAIQSWSSKPSDTTVVDVLSAKGEWLGRGLASPEESLAIRIYSRDEKQNLNDDFFCAKLSHAISMRKTHVYPDEEDTDSFRLCFSEADGISGLIVDRYASAASIETNTPVLDPYLPAMKKLLTEKGLACDGIRPVEIKESGLSYQVDLAEGQKTGFYLDQRVNRRRAAAYATGRTCLSAYCYTGAFEIHLAHAGASHVTGLDSSEPSIEQAKQNHALNPTDVPIEYSAVDVPQMLRKYRDSRTSFDMIILDPPKFVSNRKQLDKGLRAYKDINLLAMKLLNPGGILVTFSCSGWVKPESFRTALGWAAKDAKRDVQILEHLSQPPDHPVLLGFPESEYLCGYVMRVT